MKNGWIGVDLDGTLAFDEPSTHGDGMSDIGRPIKAMVDRVKIWLAAGRDVRIFTARVTNDGFRDVEFIKFRIQGWCEEHIGVILPVTNMKDYKCEAIWDDRAVQVVRNTGERVGNVER